MTKVSKLLCAIFLCSIMLSIVAGCSSVTFEPNELAQGMVGVDYSQSIDTAVSDKDNQHITYRISEGSRLPKGLELDSGRINGIPQEAISDHSFSIDAYVDGSKKAAANYSITIAKGQISYEDAVAYVIINVEDSGTVAFATGAENIKYEIVSGELPSGLALEESGMLVGTSTRLGSYNVGILASAPDCEQKEANITISVVTPFLTYSGKVLADAVEKVPYAASVAFAQADESVNITYRIKAGSKLPDGLQLSTSGIITGTPTQMGRGVPFVVVASASRYSSTEAEFLIDVIINHQSSSAGRIVNFKNTSLANGYKDEYYLNQTGVGTAASLNNNNITYKLKSGSSMPRGLTLYSNGAIFGTPVEVGNYEFAVVASAQYCEDVEAIISLRIMNGKINYSTSITAPIATRGENYVFSAATASLDGGVTEGITYSLSERDTTKLEGWGLTMTSSGIISGTPNKSFRRDSITVIAEAEEYTSSSCAVYFEVQEPLTVADKFEAEYTNLEGKTGSGYSGAPSGTALISLDANASNGRFIGYLHNNQISIDFNIYASADITTNMYLALGSELGNITLTPSSFEIVIVNSAGSTSIQYGSMSISGGNEKYNGFAERSAGNVTLKEGLNTVKLYIRSNTFKNGETGGPGIDYIRFEEKSILSWHPFVFNIG